MLQKSNMYDNKSCLLSNSHTNSLYQGKKAKYIVSSFFSPGFGSMEVPLSCFEPKKQWSHNYKKI